jgi:hypothetical protein
MAGRSLSTASRIAAIVFIRISREIFPGQAVSALTPISEINQQVVMPVPCHSLTVGAGRCFVHYTVFGAGQEIDFVDVDHLSVKRWNVVRIALIVIEHETTTDLAADRHGSATGVGEKKI